MSPRTLFLSLLSSVVFSASLSASSPRERLVSRITKACKRASSALIDRQNKDGGYGPLVDGKSDVGITALVVWALAEAPPKYREWDGPYISAAVEYILKHQKEDGGIHDGDLWNYKTCLSIMALSSVNGEKYRDQIKKAVEFVKRMQASEESSVPFDRKRHVHYGGWGYGSTRRTDLSNTQFALEALSTGGVAPDDPVFLRARIFLSRCQNSCKTNDAITEGMIPGWGTNDDGGFMYSPAHSQLPPRKLQDGSLAYSSYGSMTYAGIKSFIYAKMDRNDERVKKAYKWICTHYTVEENPGMATEKDPERGKQGLYYYYRTMAKALLIWGEPEVPTPKGKRRWAVDLGEKLLSLQRKDGLWVNDADRWWEGIPEICTSYALLALSDVLESLEAGRN